VARPLRLAALSALRLGLGAICVFVAVGSACPAGATSWPVDQRMPALAYNTNPQILNYLLVWIEDRGTTSDVYAKRLFANGLPQGGPSGGSWRVIPDSASAAGLRHGPRADPAIAFNPVRDEYMLVYCEVGTDDSGWDVYSIRISSSGYARGQPRALATGPGDQRHPDVAVIPGDRHGDYLVVWDDDARDVDEVWAQRLQGNGLPQGKPYPLVRGVTNASDPTTSGSAVAWVDDRNGQWDLYMMRLANGQPAAKPTVVTSDVLEEFNPRFGSSGLVWNVYNPLTGVDVMGVEIIENNRSRSGTGAILVPAADQTWPDVDNGVVVFADNRSGDFDLYAVRAYMRGRPRVLGHDYPVYMDP
jgi:hypothetical protein